MHELVQVPWWVCVEAKRALHSVIEDKNSYYARVMVDDAANIRGALEHLESAIDNRKGGQPPPTLTDAEREAVERAAEWLVALAATRNEIQAAGYLVGDAATLRGLLERLGGGR